MNGPDIERATGSEGQQVPCEKAEQEGLRGPRWLGWGSGTGEAGCKVLATVNYDLTLGFGNAVFRPRRVSSIRG